MVRKVIGFLIFAGLILLCGCTLSVDFHPHGKKIPARTE